MEILDVYNKNMDWIGTKERVMAHEQGLWHQTFQCWIIHIENETPCFLLQQRSESKDVFPNRLDKSCGGHLSAGETVQDGVRELQEELGIEVNFHELIPCGIIAEETKVSSQITDREFCNVYFYVADRPLQNYKLQEVEVSGLYLIAVDDFFALWNRRIDEVELTGFDLKPNGKSSLLSSKTAKREDFTPVSERYLQLMQEGLKRIKKF